jgi:hypothetical protein
VPWKGPHIVQTKEMVGVIVREQDGMYKFNLLAQELEPQLGWRVNQQVSGW